MYRFCRFALSASLRDTTPTKRRGSPRALCPWGRRSCSTSSPAFSAEHERPRKNISPLRLFPLSCPFLRTPARHSLRSTFPRKSCAFLPSRRMRGFLAVSWIASRLLLPDLRQVRAFGFSSGKIHHALRFPLGSVR